MVESLWFEVRGLSPTATLGYGGGCPIFQGALFVNAKAIEGIPSPCAELLAARESVAPGLAWLRSALSRMRSRDNANWGPQRDHGDSKLGLTAPGRGLLGQ